MSSPSANASKSMSLWTLCATSFAVNAITRVIWWPIHLWLDPILESPEPVAPLPGDLIVAILLFNCIGAYVLILSARFAARREPRMGRMVLAGVCAGVGIAIGALVAATYLTPGRPVRPNDMLGHIASPQGPAIIAVVTAISTLCYFFAWWGTRRNLRVTMREGVNYIKQAS